MSNTTAIKVAGARTVVKAPAGQAPMLRLDGITKRYGTETVLDGVTLDVERGETVAIFGPSGAGKTVLLRLIAGMMEPDDGQLIVDGQDVVGVAPENRSVGMAFQNFALFPHMSAFENIASPLSARGNAKDRVAEGVGKIAKLLKIDHVLGHAPRQLSNGQKQRTALARALVAAPELLLLDDPLRNVDAKLRFEMRLELPRVLKRFGSTVLYVTQDYREAMALGRRIAVLIAGRIVQYGTPEEIYDRPLDIRVAKLFGDPTINLLDTRVEQGPQGAVVVIAGRSLPLGAGLEAVMGKDVLVGVRPERIAYAARGAPNTLDVKVATIIPLNDRTVRMLATSDGREIYASRNVSGDGLGEGADGAIDIDGPSALVFDKASGRRILRSTETRIPRSMGTSA